MIVVLASVTPGRIHKDLCVTLAPNPPQRGEAGGPRLPLRVPLPTVIHDLVGPEVVGRALRIVGTEVGAEKEAAQMALPVALCRLLFGTAGHHGSAQCHHYHWWWCREMKTYRTCWQHERQTDRREREREREIQKGLGDLPGVHSF